jgi:hypothetical protein
MSGLKLNLNLRIEIVIKNMIYGPHCFKATNLKKNLDERNVKSAQRNLN